MMEERKDIKWNLISVGNVPCNHCGQLELVSSLSSRKVAKEENLASGSTSTKENRKLIPNRAQEAYIAGLLQRVKLLELEVIYLKRDGHKPSSPKTKEDSKETQPTLVRQPSSLGTLKLELKEMSLKCETVTQEKERLEARLVALEERGNREKAKLLDDLCELTGKVERLQNDSSSAENRIEEKTKDLEKLIVIGKEREKTISRLEEEAKCREDDLKTAKTDLETAKTNLSKREWQLEELKEKFMESSVHVMEDAIRGLKEENRKLQQRLKEYELNEESCRQNVIKHEQISEKLIKENAEMSSVLAEVQQKWESEVRLRENRESKALFDSRELTTLRERERDLKNQKYDMQSQLDKEREKLKSISQKMSEEYQTMTSLELRLSTQKSRISELEGSLALSYETTNSMRKQNLFHQDKIASLENELSSSRSEYKALSMKLAASETRFSEAEKRCQALAKMQSHRWMEFSRMADSMKELSNSMLIQSKSNTKKAVKQDIDEDVDF